MGRRDNWNQKAVADRDALVAECIEIVKAAAPYTYSEFHELRISAELCDRSHFKRAMEVLAAKSGAKLPADLDVMLEDPDFDERVAFMKEVVVATDPIPVGVRAKRG